MNTLIRGAFRDFRCCWRQLAVTDIAYKIIAFILLTPLVAILFRVLVAASGSAVLADQDILFFFLGPVGWVCLIAVGALWLGIVALELAALMAIVATAGQQRIGVLDALRFALAKAWPVLQVTARLVVFTLLTVAPFLAVAAAAYFALLTEHDINYYLNHQPPIFFVALGVGVAIMATLLAVLLRLFTGWFFALPLVLFEGTCPSNALRVSRERAHGHRRTLLLWILGWILFTVVLSTLVTTLVFGLARLFVPHAAGSLELLLIAIGASLLLWAGGSLAVNLLSSTTFATIHFHLYRHLGSAGTAEACQLDIAETSGGDFRFKFTPLRLLAVGMVGIVVALAIGVLAMRDVRLEDDVEIIAHRGSSNAAPENTMAAVKKAIEDRADWVEIDVQETADGNVVVFHDSDFMRLGGVDLKIWDATMAELKEIDIGSWFSDKFRNERVPTLGEVLHACKGKVRVIIELKYYGHDEQLEQRMVDIVEACHMASDVAVMSLKADALKKMRALRPGWRVGQLLSVSAGDVGSISVDFLAVNARFTDRGFIRAVHGRGTRKREVNVSAERSPIRTSHHRGEIAKDVYVWTINDAVSMSTMIGRGVDGLITDKPALARSVLEQRARLSPPERLLLEMAEVFGVAAEIGEQ